MGRTLSRDGRCEARESARTSPAGTLAAMPQQRAAPARSARVRPEASRPGAALWPTHLRVCRGQALRKLAGLRLRVLQSALQALGPQR